MAFTTGTTLPMVPLRPPWPGSCPTLVYQSDSAIALGDVMIYSSGQVAIDNADTVADTIIGVAAAAASAADLDVIVALALPGVMFTANMTAGANDFTPGVFATDVGVAFGLHEAGDGYCTIDNTNTTAGQLCAHTHAYARQKGATQKSEPWTGGVGATNPRMEFSFVASIFHPQETQA